MKENIQLFNWFSNIFFWTIQEAHPGTPIKKDNSCRWGRKGMAINFVTKFDVPIMKKIEGYYGITMEELPASFSGSIC